MAHNYEEILFSRNQVKKAGKVFVDLLNHKSVKFDVDTPDPLVVINNWRAAHSFPLQVLYMHVKKSVPQTAIVAQRLKRLYSITQKLYRFPHMSLTAMQDIGGCRVIVDSIDDIYSLIAKFKKSKMRHKLKEEYDYIKRPKEDGYRSYHIVYSYFSDRNPKYNGLFIEIQIRTHIQHLWATAVETMDTFTGDPLKIGQGDPQNRQFFILASRLLAIFELSGGDLDAVRASRDFEEFCMYDADYHVLQKLKNIKEAVEFVKTTDKSNQYYLLILNRSTGVLNISQFSSSQLEEATERYNLLEKEKEQEQDVVLVSTTSYNALKKAYPNYFSDISEFIDIMERFQA